MKNKIEKGLKPTQIKKKKKTGLEKFKNQHLKK